MKLSPENIKLPVLSQSTEWPISDLHPKLLSGCVEGQRFQWLVT